MLAKWIQNVAKKARDNAGPGVIIKWGEWHFRTSKYTAKSIVCSPINTHSIWIFMLIVRCLLSHIRHWSLNSLMQLRQRVMEIPNLSVTNTRPKLTMLNDVVIAKCVFQSARLIGAWRKYAREEKPKLKSESRKKLRFQIGQKDSILGCIEECHAGFFLFSPFAVYIMRWCKRTYIRGCQCF